jgi:hypothetical protein
VVRNGYHQAREVLTAAGAVEVKAPRVNDRRVDPDTSVRQRFSSAILPAWARKSPRPLTNQHPISERPTDITPPTAPSGGDHHTGSQVA